MSVTAAPVPSAPGSRTQARIDDLRTRLRANPDDGTAYRDLAAALLQRVRENGDQSLYDQADAALVEARRLGPDDPLVLVVLGVLQLARHEFADALETGRAALAMAPIAEARGVVADALIELGQYDAAVEELQRMVDQRPNLASFARVSYARELYGDLEGALDALDLAEDAGGSVPENLAFVAALKGNLMTYLGMPEEAAREYERALAFFPDYAPALAGQGRLAVGAGDLDTAIARFGRAAEILPLPEYVIALGEAQEVAGDEAAAAQSYELARFETRLAEASGVIVDQELALFEADHGDPQRAFALATKAYDERQTIQTAHALAWAAHRAGDADTARERITEALRLGTRNPLLFFHAGVIEAEAGDNDAARAHLEGALELDAGFSATGTRDALELLANLP